jgi:hypothetical protein
MAEPQRVGEVIEASTAEFTAQCYELYQIPPLGSLVKTKDQSLELYGIVYNAATTSLEPGRRWWGTSRIKSCTIIFRRRRQKYTASFISVPLMK